MDRGAPPDGRRLGRSPREYLRDRAERRQHARPSPGRAGLRLRRRHRRRRPVLGPDLRPGSSAGGRDGRCWSRASTPSASRACRSSPSPARSSAWSWPCRRTASSQMMGLATPAGLGHQHLAGQGAGPGAGGDDARRPGRLGDGRRAGHDARHRADRRPRRRSGTNPIHYLVVPRFLACVLLIPLLTLMADFMGVIGGAVVSTQMLGVDSFHYWQHSRDVRRRRSTSSPGSSRASSSARRSR